MAVSGLAVFGAFGWMMGCSPSLDELLSDPKYARDAGAGGSGGNDPATSSSTGVPPACVGELTTGMTGAENKGLISDECGIFVQADATGGTEDGTQKNPFKSLEKAIPKANGKNVYVCTSAKLTEPVTIQVAVSVYGGFDCTMGWAYDKAKRSDLETPSDTVAMTILAKTKVAISNLGITTGKATMDGASSIAVLMSGADVTFEGCAITAGDGANGVDGPNGGPSTTPGVVDPASVGAHGVDGKNACIDIDGTPGPDLNLAGGVGPTTGCGLDSSAGGDGGNGKPTSSTDGSVGVSDVGGVSTGTAGGAGKGDVACGAAEPNGAGDGGSNGTDGDAGPAGAGKGTLSQEGYLGVAGGQGKSGTPGQGGGGGGGAKGGAMICAGNVQGGGASGGSGGAGGCGGRGGGPGTAGGSSIAVASINSMVTMTDCSLKTGKGGNGGKGGDLQSGGSGGDPGKGGTGLGGSKDACAGGKGGQGGNGGSGGGGQGGHSLAIAYLGTPVTTIGKKDMVVGALGVGGLGGNGSAANAGVNGVAKTELVFP